MSNSILLTITLSLFFFRMAFSIIYSNTIVKINQDYFQKNNSYASSLSKLGINNLKLLIDGKENKLWMEATSRQFMIYISAGEDVYTLNDEGLVHLLEKNRK